MPFIETDAGCLSETSAILDYLEGIKPNPALYPSDPFAKAKTQEVMRILEHYIELAGRRHYGHVFFKGPKSDAAVEEARPVIENGLGALKQLCSFGPYLCGSDFSYAEPFNTEQIFSVGPTFILLTNAIGDGHAHIVERHHV